MIQISEQRDLIRQITEEILSRIKGEGMESATCGCRSECLTKCPDRIQMLLEYGVVRFGLHHAHPPAANELARYIDHTLLKPEATEEQVLQLCREAVQFHFAAVCVNPSWVRLAAQAVCRSEVVVCSVVGFPLGATVPDVKAYEARRAICDGAREIDMVINIGALKSGQDELVRQDIHAVIAACREMGAHSKVIIEAALLTDEEKVKACTLAKEVGADFVKTSTGFGPGGATVQDVQLMRRVVGKEMGIKAAGGIRDAEATRQMIQAGATRVGASASLKIVQAA
jgi:deoxyribose-phosphate aldolase